MAKKKTEKITEEPEMRMHTIVLKEKDVNGKYMSMDVDTISPTQPFGEKYPIVMATVGDAAFFVPMSQINWIEQHYGVQEDLKTVGSAMDKKIKVVKTGMEIG